MQPKSPVLTEELVPREVIFAKDQPEYLPLPAIRSEHGQVTTRWEFTPEEREAIAKGADLLLSVYTYNHPLQPVRLDVVMGEGTLLAAAFEHGLLPVLTTEEM